jgi:hypothetical protein
VFKNKKALKDHEKNVDCLIKCPICRQEFDKKTMRQEHQESEHVDHDEISPFLEIDESLDEKLRENLKRYSESVKKSQGKGKSTSDPALDQWIEANIERYLNGRTSKPNATLELGQWYTIFKTLSNGEVPAHPCKLKL